MREETVTIRINRLRLYARHGVEAQERVVGNMFEVDLELDYPATAAVALDRLDGTLNYAEAVDTVKEVMAEPSALLEHVCGRLRDALMERWPAISRGTVTVAKLSPPISAPLGSVSVTLRW